MMIFETILVVGVIAWALSTYGRQGRPAGDDGSRSAERILDERFARGEIDADELKARKAALAGTRP